MFGYHFKYVYLIKVDSIAAVIVAGTSAIAAGTFAVVVGTSAVAVGPSVAVTMAS